MLIPQKYSKLLRAGFAAAVLCMAGCGGGRQSQNTGNFAGMLAAHGDAAASLPSPTIAYVTLNPASVAGGNSTRLTVELTSAAPSGGATVHLMSSNYTVVNVPGTLNIAGGTSSGTTAIATSGVNAATTVSLVAFYGGSVAGASLKVQPAVSSPITVTLQPSTVTIEAGHSASITVKTTVASGFDHSLALTASAPSGLKAGFNPGTIAAPGAGSSKATISVGSSVAAGTDSIHVKASEGTVASSATLTVKVTSSGPNPGANFQGCWYSTGGHKYQGVLVSVANPGTYAFDGDLYYGTDCNPNTQADEIGFGTPIGFGGFDWIFYFNAFADQKDMSTRWHVGNNTSQCVNYEVAPACQ